MRRRVKGAFERFSRELGRQVERQGLTEERLLEEVQQGRQDAYEDKYGRRAR